VKIYKGAEIDWKNATFFFSVNLLLYKCISFIVGADEQVLLFHTSSKDKLNIIICQRELTLYMYALFLFSLKCHFFVYLHDLLFLSILEHFPRHESGL